MLRDKLVCGMNHDAIQQKLMAQTPAELTFATAMELAQRIEIAEKDARRVTTSKDSPLSKDSPNPNAQEVHKTRTFHRKSTKKESKNRMSAARRYCITDVVAPIRLLHASLKKLCAMRVKREDTLHECVGVGVSARARNETNGHTT